MRDQGQLGCAKVVCDDVLDYRVYVTDSPDEVVRHEPERCSGCGKRLNKRARQSTEVGCEARQVFDIPPLTVHVTEHQLVSRCCSGCQTVTRAQAPIGVDTPVQYGPNIAAIIVYLYVGQFLSKKRTAEALAALFAVPVSSGTMAESRDLL